MKRYKSTRKYRCPFCRVTATRDKLVAHVQDDHELMIPEGYTAARTVYDYINKKDYGTCMICKKKVYEWDETICRYKNICDDPKCMAQLKARSAKNHLDDPEVQKKMLAGRRISGYYKFKDGTVHSYVGSYEKNCLEFMDQVLNIEGKDLMTPGPTIYYEWNGEKHPWILDWMYIPAMLCADVKDGGSNPNTRPMEDYRSKQLAKEEAIAKEGKYNYIRLTDNNFGQLLEALADIRQGTINHDPINHIYINESSYYAIKDVNDRYDETDDDELDVPLIYPDVTSPGVMAPKLEAVGGMPRANAHNDYIIPRMMDGLTFTDRTSMYFGNTGLDKMFHFDAEGNLIEEDKKSRLECLADCFRLVFKTNKLSSISNDMMQSLGEDGLISYLSGKEYTGYKDLIMENVVKISNSVDNEMVQDLIMNGIVKDVKTVISEITNSVIHEEFIESKGNISIHKDEDGYYLTSPEDFLMVSNHYDTYNDIPDGLIDMMNNIYKNRIKETKYE